jgi:hypothetical protein
MSISAALVLPVVLAAVAPAAAGDVAAQAPRANVAITLTIGRAGGAPGFAEKVYRVLGQEGSETRMLMGWRTPIPTRASEDKGGDAASTSYVYQNVGVTADLETTAVGSDRLLVTGEIEISGAREGATATPASSGKPPMIATFQQVLHVVLTLGEKLRVAEGPDPDGGTLYLDLRADRLK